MADTNQKPNQNNPQSNTNPASTPNVNPVGSSMRNLPSSLTSPSTPSGPGANPTGSSASSSSSGSNPLDETTEKIGEAVSNVRDTVSHKAEEVSELVGEKVSDVRGSATHLKEHAVDTAMDMRHNAQPWVNRINSTASDLNTRTRNLVHQGNQRRLILERENRVMLDLPLTVATLGGALLVIAAPALAALSVAGAFIGKVSARVERNKPL